LLLVRIPDLLIRLNHHRPIVVSIRHRHSIRHRRHLTHVLANLVHSHLRRINLVRPVHHARIHLNLVRHHVHPAHVHSAHLHLVHRRHLVHLVRHASLLVRNHCRLRNALQHRAHVLLRIGSNLVRIRVKISLKLVRRLLVHPEKKIKKMVRVLGELLLSHHIRIKAVHVRRRHPHCLAGADGHACGHAGRSGTSDIIRARARRRAEQQIFRIIGRQKSGLPQICAVLC